MATTGPLPAPYDDGSSTESEYYFDPEEEEAPYEHEPQVKQEPLTVQENTAIKQEYTNERTLQEGAEEIQPPKGSEWSHGAAVVCDNAVERALAMASRFERAMSRTQREEELTADTMHSNERSTSPLKSSEEGAKTANLKKKKKVKVKSKMVSLKSVKATTPTVAAMKPVVVGLRRPPSIVTGAPIELEKGLSVPRSSSRKSPANQSSTRQKASPSHGKTKQNAQTEEKLLILRHQTERKKSPSVRRTELEKLSLSRQSEQSKLPQSFGKKRSRSPSHHRRTERSNSPLKDYSRRSRSRSPPRRPVKERRKRSRSRYHDTENASSPRHHHGSEKRSRHSCERRSNLSIHDRRRSRSRSFDRERDRYDHGHEARHEHYDNSERKSAPRDINKTDHDPRRRSHREPIPVTHGKQQSDEDAVRYRNRDVNTSPSERTSHKKNALPARNEDQIGGRSAGRSNAVVTLNRGRSGSKSRLQTPDESSSSTALPNHRNVTKRTPTDPRIGPPKQKNAVSHSSNNPKKPTFVHHDAFARRVFKLKLQEADVDEKTTTGSHGSDKWFYENRRRGIAAERARLMAQNLERFEILYATSTVSKSELKRYQDDRDFAWRVVQFKRKQASLQEQNDLFISSEKRVELWRRLDQDREKLIAENGAMFHKVMMSQGQTEGTFRARERDAFTTNADAPRRPGKRVHDKQLHKGQPKLYRQASDNPSTMLHSASTNSRVVVGAALADNHNTLHSQPSSVPWFLKG